MQEVKRKKDKPNANSDSDEKRRMLAIFNNDGLCDGLSETRIEKEKIEKLQSNCLNEMEKFTENQADFGAKLRLEKY